MASEEAPPLESLGKQVSLFLDLDGVLAAIEPKPDMVVPDAARTRMLKSLQDRLEGRLAVVSGRTIEDVDRITEGAVTCVAGVHGIQIRMPDASRLPEIAPDLKSARERVLEFARIHPLILVEDKTVALTMHYRDTPSSGPEVLALAQEIADTYGLTRQSGHFVEEVRARGRDKGDALRTYMAHPRFQNTVPVMVGDDRTDEDGFEAAQSLGGVGIRVRPAGPTLARYHLDSSDHVARWLNDYLSAERRGPWDD